MASNKIFNNERPSSIRPESVFYGKMTSDKSIPTPKFTDGEIRNPSIDYGNKWSQNIRSSQVVVRDKKNGLNFR